MTTINGPDGDLDSSNSGSLQHHKTRATRWCRYSKTKSTKGGESFRQIPSRAGALERPGLFLTAAVLQPRMLGLFWWFLSSFIEKQILGSSPWDWLCCKTTSSPVVSNDLLDPGQEAVLVALRALVFVYRSVCSYKLQISKQYSSLCPGGFIRAWCPFWSLRAL